MARPKNDVESKTFHVRLNSVNDSELFAFIDGYMKRGKTFKDVLKILLNDANKPSAGGVVDVNSVVDLVIEKLQGDNNLFVLESRFDSNFRQVGEDF